MHSFYFRPIISLFILLTLIGCRRGSDETPPAVTPTLTTVVEAIVTPEMTIAVEMPLQVEFGERFNIIVRVSNLSADPVQNVTVQLPMPPDSTIVTAPVAATQTASTLAWTIEAVQAGATLTELLTFSAPYQTGDLDFAAAQLRWDDQTIATAQPQKLIVTGGTLPVSIARERIGEVVRITGAVTLYGGSLFYVADETGGVRVQIPDSAPNIAFDLGQMVTVMGEIVPYDGSVAIQLDPETLDATPCQACVPQEQQPPATAQSPGVVVSTAGIVQEIVVVDSGTWITLQDENGETQQIWTDDRVGISAETVTVGQQATVIGIYDDWNGSRAIAPRQQSDLVPIFPQTLRLTFDSPIAVALTRPVTHTLTIYNESDEPRTNVVVSAAVPQIADQVFAGTVITNSVGGQLGTDGVIYWGVPNLPPNSSQTFTYQIQYFQSAQATTTLSARAENSADEITLTDTIYIGQPVPIFAIQSGESSPLRGREVVIEGIVTLIAPSRGGFYMQQPSDVLIRSVGVFVETLGEPSVASGDAVQVRGVVQERNDETVIVEMRGGIIVQSSDNPLPQALPFDPPSDSAEIQAYIEPFEGMLVELDEPLIVVDDTTDEGLTTLVFERYGLESADSVYNIVVAGLGNLQRGDMVEPLRGVVSGEFDQYVILKQ